MPKFTIVAKVDTEEVDLVADWIECWKDRLTFFSGNYGCGCCVDMYNIDGPQEAKDELPRRVLASSSYTDRP